jgi:hypothetical protein
MDWKTTEYTLPHFINDKYTFIHFLFRINLNVACVLSVRFSTAIGMVSWVQSGSHLDWLLACGSLNNYLYLLISITRGWNCLCVTNWHFMFKMITIILNSYWNAATRIRLLKLLTENLSYLCGTKGLIRPNLYFNKSQFSVFALLRHRNETGKYNFDHFNERCLTNKKQSIRCKIVAVLFPLATFVVKF